MLTHQEDNDMITTVSRATSEPKVIDTDSNVKWFKIFEHDSYDNVDVFFNNLDELKAFSESLAKQVGELNG